MQARVELFPNKTLLHATRFWASLSLYSVSFLRTQVGRAIHEIPWGSQRQISFLSLLLGSSEAIMLIVIHFCGCPSCQPPLAFEIDYNHTRVT